jgi:hypothetical protein
MSMIISVVVRSQIEKTKDKIGRTQATDSFPFVGYVSPRRAKHNQQK